MRDMKRDMKRDLKKQTKQYTKARQGSSSSTRTKKRSNEMVQSWIESLPGGGGQKTNTSGGGGDEEQGQGQDHGQVVVNIDMPESTQVVAERERCVKSKSDAFSSLSILIPQTCTNISRNDDIIEVHEDEMKYFADKSPGADDIDLEDLRHNKKQMAMAMERKEGMQLHSHSHSQQKNWCKRINSRLDTVYSKIRRQLHNIPRISSLKDNGVDLRYGCYSIQTLSNSSSMSPMSGSDDDSEDQLSGCEKKNLTTPKTDAEDADAAAPHDSCRPSIARVKDKMSFHTNVPSSMLTFTICAF
eukprot:CAMPEP_0197481596 /NCGR_PEP_ID=MMETSP1309-20131121/48445_1 /TAXON_ID=464262 /ORGANISM="Genus nov. species nov., Strain RCC998" /LENGTH=299 /DNA_ID=CAMNT_0043023871 /DNA_START=45 /DNA_END=941 /DNA_ORIENTATION=-